MRDGLQHAHGVYDKGFFSGSAKTFSVLTGKGGGGGQRKGATSPSLSPAHPHPPTLPSLPLRRSVEWPRINMLTGGVRDFPVGLGLRPWYLAGFTGAVPVADAAGTSEDDLARAAAAAGGEGTGRGGRPARPPAVAIVLYTVLPITAAALAGSAAYFYRTAKTAAAATAAATAAAGVSTLGVEGGAPFAARAVTGEGKAPAGLVFEVPVFAATPGPAIAPARLQTLAVELAVPDSGVGGAVGTGRSPVSTPRSRRARGGGGGSPHAPV